MEITPTDLANEYTNALKQWPFIPDLEHTYALPRCILFAIGSRETNLRNVIGDGGHGNGVWQLDNRSHTIPSGFNDNVHAQGIKAASMVAASIAHFKGNVRAALAAYNAGTGTVEYNLANNLNVDTGTANGNYSADVYDRMIWLQNNEEMESEMSSAEFQELQKDIQELRKFVHDIFSIRDSKNVPHQFSAYTISAWASHGGIPDDVKKKYGLK